MWYVGTTHILYISTQIAPSLFPSLQIFRISILQNLISTRSINRSSQGIELGLYSLNIYPLHALYMCVSCCICCILFCGCVWCVAWTVYKIPRWCNEGRAQKKGNFRSFIFYIRQLSETHSVALCLSLSLLHTHTLLQESASMFSKIEFLKIVLGKEATGNMKALVEPTTLPAARSTSLCQARTHTAHTHTTHTHYVHLAVFFGCGTSSTSSFRHSTKSMQLSPVPFLLHTL